MSASKAVALHTATVTYPGSAEYASAARASLRGLLGSCPLADDAILCASELAANAILHSQSGWPGGQFTVRATLSPDEYVRIEVDDEGGPWTLVVRDPLRGHGLDVIQSLAADWGIDGDYRGRTFWVRLDWPIEVPPSTAISVNIAGRPGGDSGSLAASGPGPGDTGDAGPRNRRMPQWWTVMVDGQRLRNLRGLRGLSQERLAYQAGVSITTVANLERQPAARCHRRTLARLAGALGEHPVTLTSTVTR